MMCMYMHVSMPFPGKKIISKKKKKKKKKKFIVLNIYNVTNIF
jgi:hypothetical protein